MDECRIFESINGFSIQEFFEKSPGHNQSILAILKSLCSLTALTAINENTIHGWL